MVQLGKRRFVSVEFPGALANPGDPSGALRSLGGVEKVSRALSHAPPLRSVAELGFLIVKVAMIFALCVSCRANANPKWRLDAGERAGEEEMVGEGAKKEEGEGVCLSFRGETAY